jgi:putative DNA primase/helicase
LGCNYNLSLADGEDGRLLAHCFGGCSFKRVRAALVEFGLLDDVDGDGDEQDAVHRHAEPDPTKIAAAVALYEAGRPGDRIERYLKLRAITIVSPVLRFHEKAPHRLGGAGPAMLAPVVNVTGEQTGTHVTFLSRLGDGKAELHRDHQRECRGAVRGGAIRLAEHDPDQDLIMGEGIESTLSAMQIFGLPGWSTVSAGGLKTVVLPPSVRRVIIAVDNDMSGCGQSNAFAAYERWTAEGRTVRIKIPPVKGDDFNNVLIKRRADER